jgi:hypothetical protein
MHTSKSSTVAISVSRLFLHNTDEITIFLFVLVLISTDGGADKLSGSIELAKDLAIPGLPVLISIVAFII